MDYDKLSLLMRQKKISRQKMAKTIGVSYDTFMSAINRKSLSSRVNAPDMVMKIASVLECDLQDILTNDEKLALIGFMPYDPKHTVYEDNEITSAAQFYDFSNDYFSIECEKRLVKAFRSLSSSHDKSLAVALVETLASEGKKVDEMFERQFMKEQAASQNNTPEDK